LSILQCNTYREQYNAAASTAKELQKQLDEVADLQQAISEAREVQVSLTHSEVLHHGSTVFLLRKTMVVAYYEIKFLM